MRSTISNWCRAMASSEVVGPAVIDFPHTSVTVPAGWRGELIDDGDVSMERTLSVKTD